MPSHESYWVRCSVCKVRFLPSNRSTRSHMTCRPFREQILKLRYRFEALAAWVECKQLAAQDAIVEQFNRQEAVDNGASEN